MSGELELRGPLGPGPPEGHVFEIQQEWRGIVPEGGMPGTGKPGSGRKRDKGIIMGIPIPGRFQAYKEEEEASTPGLVERNMREILKEVRKKEEASTLA